MILFKKMQTKVGISLLVIAVIVTILSKDMRVLFMGFTAGVALIYLDNK